MASVHPRGRRPARHTALNPSVTQTGGFEPVRAVGQSIRFDSGASGLLTVIGSDARFKRVGPTFPHAFGYTEGELLEQPFIAYIHPVDRPATYNALEMLAQGQPTLGLENRFLCKDGSFRHLAWTAMPTPEGLVYAVARDITGRAGQQDEPGPLPADEQVAALAQKESLLASVCHDLQQPLTVILAQAQLMQRQLTRGEKFEADGLDTRLAYIFTAATRMRIMTEELLDASLQESGHSLDLLLATTELVALTRQAISEHELVSNLHQFLFEAEVPTLEAAVDSIRVHRVLANLLTNAIKYSPGGCEVRVTLKTNEGPDGKSAILVVRDEGLGIPADDLPHVFDRFHRGSNVIGRFTGSGLGLASAREMVELHGGTITVDSVEGRGSTFVVRLPLAPKAEQAQLQ